MSQLWQHIRLASYPLQSRLRTTDCLPCKKWRLSRKKFSKVSFKSLVKYLGSKKWPKHWGWGKYQTFRLALYRLWETEADWIGGKSDMHRAEKDQGGRLGALILSPVEQGRNFASPVLNFLSNKKLQETPRRFHWPRMENHQLTPSKPVSPSMSKEMEVYPKHYGH